MKRSMITGMLALALVASFGCKDNKKPDSQPATNTTTTTNNDTAGAAADAETTQTAAAADDADADENTWEAKFDTTAGEFIVEVHPSWSPNGAERFRELVEAGYYTDIAAFRVIDGFMAQFGIHGDPEMNKKWKDNMIEDDPNVEGVSNKRGYITFAKQARPNTRTTQLFINYRDNSALDAQGFTPFGVVKGDGMKVVDSFYKGYGEGAPRGKGPDQGRAQEEGNKYFKENFPELTYIKSVTVVGEDGTGAAAQDDGAKPGDKPADDKPAAPKKAWEAGSYSDGEVKAAGMEGVKLQLNLKDDGSVTGKVQGKREGKGFAIALKGSVNDQGVMTAEGSQGPNNFKLRGKAKDGAVKGSLMGKINDKGARATFNASK